LQRKHEIIVAMVTLLALYSFGGLLLAGLSVPLILHKIPPNGLYGFRVPSTLENPQLWYKVNAYAGRRFLVVGLGTAVGAIILYFVTLPNVDEYALSSLGLFLAFFLWGIITSFLHLRTNHPGSFKSTPVVDSETRQDDPNG
jgi:hypothetical protein